MNARTATILLLTCMAGLLILRPSRAGETPAPSMSVLFQNAYDLLLDADAARDAHRQTEASSLYAAAHDMYVRLSREHPEWQQGVVRFRMAYCRDQLSAIQRDQSQPEPLPDDPPDAPIATNAVVRPFPDAPPDTDAPRRALNVAKARARVLIEKGQAGQARELLIEALQTAPDDRDIRLLIAAAQCRAGSYDDADAVLTELVSEGDKSALVQILLGSALFGQGKMAEALTALERALAISPELPDAHFNLVQVYLHLDPPDPDAARRHYGKFLQLGGESSPDLDKILE